MDEPMPTRALRAAIQYAVVLTAAILGLAFLAVQLADVLLMAFGAVLVAVLMHAIAEPLQTRLRMRRPLALGAAVVVIGASISLAVWAFGLQAAAQFSALDDLLPRAWTRLHAWLSPTPFGAAALAKLEAWQGFDWFVSLGPKLAADAAGAMAGTVIVLFAGLYLSFNPRSYLGGVLLLFPKRHRPRADAVFGETYSALRQWLIGQLCSMVLVGFTTWAGLALAGVPSAVALGVISGLGQFVPVIGPMAATVPGLLVALEVSPQTLMWAGVVYLFSAQLEANVFTPLVLRQLAQLPMAVTLFAVLAMGVLLGPLGILFATPLAVVAYVVVRMVYVEGVLGEQLAHSSGARPAGRLPEP